MGCKFFTNQKNFYRRSDLISPCQLTLESKNKSNLKILFGFFWEDKSLNLTKLTIFSRNIYCRSNEFHKFKIFGEFQDSGCCSRSGDSSDYCIPTTPTTKSIPKVDSAGSSLSSCGSIPPPSPGLTLSPPMISNPPNQGWHHEQTRRLTTPPTTPPWVQSKSR